MLRLILILALITLYFQTPSEYAANVVAQLGTYKDYAFSFWIAVLLTPSITPWFE